MMELRLKVDRVEEGIAVCYAPDGGMTDVPLPDDLIDTVKDGATVKVQYDGDVILSVVLCEAVDPKHDERQARLARLFGRK